MNRFKAFWFARTFSYFGDFVFGMTIMWYAVVQGDAWEVAAVASLSMLFRFFGSFLIAPLINYIGSRVMIVCTDYLRAICNVLLWLLVITHSTNPVLSLCVVSVNAFIGGGFDAGMQAYVPTIVSELRKANADLSTGRSTVQLLGYLAGGALMQWYYGYGFLFNAFTFVVAGTISYFIGGGERTLHEPILRKGLKEISLKMAGNWRVAWQTLRGSSTLRLAFWTTVFINAFIVPALSLIAPLVKNEVGGGSVLYSVTQSASMIGSLLGAAWIRRSKKNNGNMIIFGSLCCGLSGVVAGSSHMVFVLIITMMLFGLGLATFNIAENTVIQENEPHLRASIYAVMQLSTMVLYPISSMTLARLGTVISIQIPFLIGGLVVILATLFFAWRWYLDEQENKSGNGSTENAEMPL